MSQQRSVFTLLARAGSYATIFLKTPPVGWPDLVRKKVMGERYVPSVSSVLSATKTRAQRPYDFLSRYEAILSRTIEWTPIDFRERTVLELGCGPDLGWLPLAVFRGARHCIAVDPEVNTDTLHSPRFEDEYLRPMHKDLSAIYGEGPPFSDFLSRVRGRTTLHRTRFRAGLVDEEIDLFMSNSCLEHIDDLRDVLATLRAKMHGGGRFLNLVDFGNHRSKARPFANMYGSTRDAYFRRFGRGINLMKPSEMLDAFRTAGFRPNLVPYYWAKEHDEPISSDWSGFDQDDLFLKAALIVGSVDSTDSSNA